MAEQAFFATCPKGLEGLLKAEMEQLGATDVRETIAGVSFNTDLRGGYRACLWSRLANKVLLPLGRFDAADADELYEAARKIPWQTLMSPTGTLMVDFTGSSDTIRNTQFGAVKIKDAVVDIMRETSGQRPSVSKNNPDLRINARLSRGKIAISLDMCGDSLHRRGYRTRQGVAPLKENLAAAILIRANWPELAEKGHALIDPMCGSGTILVEAAMIAADKAPGLDRPQFAFEQWPDFDANMLAELREEALERHRDALAKGLPEIRGYDDDPRVLDAAQSNIEKAGLEDFVRVLKKPLKDFVKPTHKLLECGLLITNPPYGERLGEKDDLKGLYRQLGDKCRAELLGWQVAIFTGNPELGKSMGIRAFKRYKLFNGTIPSELLLLNIEADQFVDAPPPVAFVKPLTPGAEMLVNRLKKNKKQLAKWVKNESVQCYRLYDADMPEYSAAIDIYGDYVHVQEYAAPKTIDEEKAIARFAEIQAAVPVALGVDEDKISFKQRRRNRGKQQYERQEEKAYPLIPVTEGNANILVNLWEYLDTGLFLDHRPVRLMIQDLVRGKRFLNLFCYTATATVHAAIAGAKESVSVDMSYTYLKWAEKNFLANNISTDKHKLEQGDCLKWLRNCRQGFDVIMLDPPSFSNSKRMDDVLDVQRDHVQMIERCMELLTPGGTLVFSNNLRTFKMDSEALSAYQLENISAKTLDPDFKRNPKIHQCWLIRH